MTTRESMSIELRSFLHVPSVGVGAIWCLYLPLSDLLSPYVEAYFKAGDLYPTHVPIWAPYALSNQRTAFENISIKAVKNEPTIFLRLGDFQADS